ncbi:hypothetical protein GCM10022216_14340 [Sphingobacterium kyonggiense]|uniref:Uncharacterized protein n=1 Tax=Sphingobacterium kyonggiense TaxID=714075 RepID=A0ABP7YM04_9SPHI
MKTYKMWAFKLRDGTISNGSIFIKRTEVILWAEQTFLYPWKKIKRLGHSAVKVELSEIVKSKSVTIDKTQPFLQLGLFDNREFK